MPQANIYDGPYTLKIETFRDERKTRTHSRTAATELARCTINNATERMTVTVYNMRGEELEEFNTHLA